MERDDPPRQLQAPLQLSDGHLKEQDAQEQQRHTEDPRREASARSEEAQDD